MSVENMDRGNRITKVVQQEQPTSYIENELMERTLSNYSINPLFVFLTGIIGKEETERIFQLYKVGTSKKVEWCYCLLANRLARTSEVRQSNALQFV
jgi:tRNA 2-selenouridine synthase SelU